MIGLLVLVLGLAGASPIGDDKVCQPHSKPWQVYLQGGGVSCSGVLIDRWWIATSFINCSPTPYQTTASLGEHDLTVEEGTEQHIRVAQVIKHSPYYRGPLHSLTMVRLAQPARLNQYVQPIPLPSRCPRAGEACSVSGWGSTTPNHYEPPQRLKCITVPVVDDQTCRDSFPMFWSYNMFCAGQRNTNNCMRDGGSVMVCDGQLQGIQWVNNGCTDQDNPTGYTKLCLYNDWIKQVMDRYGPTTTTASTAWRTTRRGKEARLDARVEKV